MPIVLDEFELEFNEMRLYVLEFQHIKISKPANLYLTCTAYTMTLPQYCPITRLLTGKMMPIGMFYEREKQISATTVQNFIEYFIYCSCQILSYGYATEQGHFTATFYGEFTNAFLQ